MAQIMARRSDALLQTQDGLRYVAGQTGGFAVVETDNSADLFGDLAAWGPWLEFEVVPVLDIAEATPIAQDALHKARSVL